MKNLLTIIIILIGGFHSVFACSCYERRTVREELKHVDAVIVGKVIANELITLTDQTIQNIFPDHQQRMKTSRMNGMAIRMYTFLVESAYKGKITKDTVTIYTGKGGGDCGVKFEVGKKYIVYGETRNSLFNFKDYYFPKMKNTYWTYDCLRTTLFSQNEIIEIEKHASGRHIKIK